jgi:hypothetical protein
MISFAIEFSKLYSLESSRWIFLKLENAYSLVFNMWKVHTRPTSASNFFYPFWERIPRFIRHSFQDFKSENGFFMAKLVFQFALSQNFVPNNFFGLRDTSHFPLLTPKKQQRKKNVKIGSRCTCTNTDNQGNWRFQLTCIWFVRQQDDKHECEYDLRLHFDKSIRCTRWKNRVIQIFALLLEKIRFHTTKNLHKLFFSTYFFSFTFFQFLFVEKISQI